MSAVSVIFIVVDPCIEHKGKTLHLLKQKAKEVPQQRKRRKLTVFGEGNEERKQEQRPESVTAFQQKQQKGPNIIGNVEDFKTSMAMTGSSKPIFDPNQSGNDYFQ